MRKTAMKIALISTLSWFCLQISFNTLARAEEKNFPGRDKIASFYRPVLVRIMQFQEQKFNVRFTDVPELKFEQLPYNEKTKILTEGECFASEDKEIIFLNDFYRECIVPLMTTRVEGIFGTTTIRFGYEVKSGTGRCNPANIKAILAHELGHVYSNQLSKSIGNGIWIPPESEDVGSVTPECRWRYAGHRIVSEGIAEYFWKELVGAEDSFTDSDWAVMNDRVKERENPVEYPYVTRAGFHFVKPIIDRFGQRGIEYLIKNPLVIENLDFMQMPQKQIQIMDLLEELDSSH